MNKKRFLFPLYILFCLFSAQAQELFDALSFSELPTQGTARAMSMSGAFGALGGEPTSLITNPAGLGIYRSCEATLSLYNNYSQHKIATNFNDNNRITLSQASYVHSILPKNKVLIASNFAVSFNRLKNFQNKYTFDNNASASIVNYMAEQANGISENALLESNNPFDNPQIGRLAALGYGNYLIKPSGLKQWNPMTYAQVASKYKCVESGSIDEINVSYAVNLAHWVYLGASVGIQSLEKTTVSLYTENFYSLNEEELQLKNRLTFSGVGMNFKIGAIVRPVSFLRVGFAYHTPTFYAISQYSTTDLESRNVLDEKSNLVDVSSSTGDNSDSYHFRTPSRYLFSAAFIINKKGLIDVDYELVDYRSMRYSDDFSTDGFYNENKFIRNYAKINHTLKIGGEYRVLDFLSLRLGGAFATPTVDGNAAKTLPQNSIRTDLESLATSWSYNVSCGIGFRWTYWGIDLAYQYNQQYATFTPFAGAKQASLTNYYHNILLTGSFRF